MFSIKQLSDLAGVSRRTLHYYDAIGLLQPTRIAENGYRWYSEQDLLRLQQILLYREAGLPLLQIKKILDERSFDAIIALQQHEKALVKQKEHLDGLIETVKQTIKHLKGELEMSPTQLFGAFSEEEEKKYEKEAMQMYDPETVKESNARWRAYSKADKERIGREGNAAYDAMVKAIPRGADSLEAQAGVEAWRKHMSYFWEPEDEQLLGLADLYNEDPRFKANFDKVHPDLAVFMREAIRIYVEGRK